MSGFNGSGTFQISGVGLPYTPATTISSSVANTLNNDLATGLSNCITKDGQQVVAANIGWNNYNINNLSALGIGTSTPTGKLQVVSGATTNFIVDSSGYVGIGTNSPTKLLTVSGGNALINNVEVGSQNILYNSVFVGKGCYNISTVAQDTVVVGNYILTGAEGVEHTTVIGSYAMNAGEGSSNCTVVGAYALADSYYDTDCIAIGYNSLRGSINNTNCISVGNNAAYTSNNSSQCISIGNNAYYNATDSNDNIAIGDHSQYAASLPFTNNNISIGTDTLRNNTCSSDNVAIGYAALYGFAPTSTGSPQTGGNVAVGHYAGSAVTSGKYNTIIGYQAADLLTSGNDNTCIGSDAGSNITTGSDNVCIGNNSQTATATSSNSFTLGNSSITVLRCHVTSITSLSDARDKTNVQPLPSVLNFVDKLKPVEFDWNMRDGGKVGDHQIGFIAQDLQQAQQDAAFNVPNLIYADNPDKLEANYGALLPVLVKAIQEQQALIADLTYRIEALEA